MEYISGVGSVIVKSSHLSGHCAGAFSDECQRGVLQNVHRQKYQKY